MFFIDKTDKDEKCFLCEKEAEFSYFTYLINLPSFPISVCRTCLSKMSEKIELALLKKT